MASSGTGRVASSGGGGVACRVVVGVGLGLLEDVACGGAGCVVGCGGESLVCRGELMLDKM